MHLWYRWSRNLGPLPLPVLPVVELQLRNSSPCRPLAAQTIFGSSRKRSCTEVRFTKYLRILSWDYYLALVPWRCWLGGRNGIRPVKTEWWGAGVAVCLERGADLQMAQVMPLPLTVFCFSKIQICLPFSYRLARVVPDKETLNGCVCVCYHNITLSLS